MDDLGEKELIARCRQGEPAAWEELFHRYYGAVGRFVYQLASDLSREDVEEICQEAFLLVVRHLDSFHGGSQFQTWLFRLAANKAHDYRQKRKATKRGGGVLLISLDQPRDPDLPAVDPPAPQLTPDASMIQREQFAVISRALQEAGSPCQEMIELKYFGDLSYEEIGAVMRLNPKTVSSRLSRCLDRLEEIAQRGLKAEMNI